MKFKKTKRPKTLPIAFSGTNTCCLRATQTGTAKLDIGYQEIGPREAVRMAKWLVRYYKWSSLQ